MKFNIKNLILVVVAIAVLVTISSCHRGVGCPTNFSADSPVVDVVKTLTAFIK